MPRPLPLILAAVLAVALAPARAWHGRGHVLVVRCALATQPAGEPLPAFFTEAGRTIALAALDPDYFRDKTQPQLDSTEAPEHYLDLEYLKGKPLPRTRYEYLKLLAELGVTPRQAGTLPYAVTEWTQRLTLAFAQYRREPDNPAVRAKCLIYAGLLSHYAADLCQPLHTTLHYDGRAGADGKSPRSGIHGKVDALLQRVPVDAARAAREVRVEPVPDLFTLVVAQIKGSHALVDRVYDLEDKLPPERPAGGPESFDPAVVRFTQERLQAAVSFTATLYATAWRDSARIKVPDWSLGKGQEHP